MVVLYDTYGQINLQYIFYTGTYVQHNAKV